LRFRYFAGVFVGRSDDGGIGDRCAGEQDRFQFGGRDLMCVVFDQFFLQVAPGLAAARLSPSR
jgi:hypothetical protein